MLRRAKQGHDGIMAGMGDIPSGIRAWREFMGVKVETAARAAGMDMDQYQAFETYPINFNLQQVVSLADAFGVRGDQFWFPPPKRKEGGERARLPAKGRSRA